MSVDPNKLLVLKAYYLGRAIAKRGAVKEQALEAVDSAITTLERSDNVQKKRRLLFYVLLKAQILRETDSVYAIRKQAKVLSEQITSRVYNDYIAVEEATQTQKQRYGVKDGIIADQFRSDREQYHTGGLDIHRMNYDAAISAIGIDASRLSDRDVRFLRRVSLKEMLEKHGIPSSL